MYKIKISTGSREHPLLLKFMRRRDAMEAWDKAVDDALPGDKLQLIDAVNHRVMSEYNPQDITWRTL